MQYKIIIQINKLFQYFQVLISIQYQIQRKLTITTEPTILRHVNNPEDDDTKLSQLYFCFYSTNETIGKLNIILEDDVQPELSGFFKSLTKINAQDQNRFDLQDSFVCPQYLNSYIQFGIKDYKPKLAKFTQQIFQPSSKIQCEERQLYWIVNSGEFLITLDKFIMQDVILIGTIALDDSSMYTYQMLKQNCTLDGKGIKAVKIQ